MARIVFNLIRLHDVFSGQGPAKEARAHILDEAVQGQDTDAAALSEYRDDEERLVLYTQVPVDWTIAERSKQEIVDNPLALATISVPEQLAARGLVPLRETIPHSTVEPVEVQFVALSPSQVRRLQSGRTVQAHCFSHGLELVPEYFGFPAGYAVRSDKPLVVRPAQHRAKPDLCFGMKSIYLAAAAASRICDIYKLPAPETAQYLPQPAQSAVFFSKPVGNAGIPSSIEDLAPGVSILCQVAIDCFGRLPADARLNTEQRRKAAMELRRRNPKLFNKEVARQAVALIDRQHNQSKGIVGGRAFTRAAINILQDPERKRRLQLGESLALILHVTEEDLILRKKPPPPEAPHRQLIERLRLLGFDGKAQLKAIHAIITWS